MECHVRLSATLVLASLLCRAVGLPQDQVDKPRKQEATTTRAGETHDLSTANVNISISAEGMSALPSGSKIQWEGIGDSCNENHGDKPLNETKATPLSLPVCKVKLTIFVTGFDTKTATVDLVGNEGKYGDPIVITLKHNGPAEVIWKKLEH